MPAVEPKGPAATRAKPSEVSPMDDRPPRVGAFADDGALETFAFLFFRRWLFSMPALKSNEQEDAFDGCSSRRLFFFFLSAFATTSSAAAASASACRSLSLGSGRLTPAVTTFLASPRRCPSEPVASPWAGGRSDRDKQVYDPSQRRPTDRPMFATNKVKK